jgi:hypothetical protein
MRGIGNCSPFARRGAKVALAVCCGFVCAWAASRSIRSASADPAAIRPARATPILFTALIEDPAVIASSVNLQRLNAATGAYSLAGTLYDDGTHGDLSARDGVFSLRITLNERGPFPVLFRISAALRGSPNRIFSPAIALNAAGPDSAAIELKPDSRQNFSDFRTLAEIFTPGSTYIRSRVQPDRNLQ